jgi:hypothetical protein
MLFIRKMLSMNMKNPNNSTKNILSQWKCEFKKI